MSESKTGITSNITALVRAILMQDERTRNSDSYLYLRVISIMGEGKGYRMDKFSVTEFLLSMERLGFPGFETVRRTRQKLQRAFPELAAKRDVEEARKEKEKAFREYAREDEHHADTDL